MSLKIYDPLATEEVSSQPENISDDARAKIRGEIKKLKASNRYLKAKETWAKRIHDQNEAVKATVSAVVEMAKPVEQMTAKELAHGLQTDRSFKLPNRKDESRIGHHFTADDGKVYGDTTLVSAMEKVGGELVHMGFGDFKAKFQDGGTIEFMRDDDYPIPNKNGRAHRLVASTPILLARILKKLEEEKLSINTSAKPEVKQVSEPVHCVLERQETGKELRVVLPQPPPSLPTPAPVQLTTRSTREEILARINANPAAWPGWRKRAYGITD